MMRGHEEALLARTRRLAEEAGIDVAGIVPDLCAGWDELRRLAADPAVTFGSHTLSHAILAKRDPGDARIEIDASGPAIAARLGRPVRHIAYPLGGPRDAGQREFTLAQASGYATGLTTRPGHVGGRHRASLTALPRVSMNGHHQTKTAVRSLLSGCRSSGTNSRARHGAPASRSHEGESHGTDPGTCDALRPGNLRPVAARGGRGQRDHGPGGRWMPSGWSIRIGSSSTTATGR